MFRICKGKAEIFSFASIIYICSQMILHLVSVARYIVQRSLMFIFRDCDQIIHGLYGYHHTLAKFSAYIFRIGDIWILLSISLPSMTTRFRLHQYLLL